MRTGPAAYTARRQWCKACVLCAAMQLLVTLGLTAAGAQAEGQRAIFDLTVNQQPKGEVFVYLQGQDVYARVSDLREAGLGSLDSGHTIRVQGDEFVLLASFAPDITYQVDETAFVLQLTVRSALLGTTTLNLGLGRPAGMMYSDNASAFVNYAVHLHDFRSVDAFWEGGVTFGDTLMYSGLLLNEQGQWVRGLTNVTMSGRDDLRSLAIGDALVAARDPLGGGAFVGGISLSRNFALDPYVVRFPTQSLSGALSTPSTLQVYTNGQLVRQEALPPGMFQLANIPVALGSGNTQVVIKDAFGNTQQINAPYYLATQVLAQGRSDYSYTLGFRRNAVGTASWDYGPPVGRAYHRYGFTDWLTAGWRAEGDPHHLSMGLLADIGTPLGQIEMALAGSDARGGPGGAASLGYVYVTPRYSVGGSASVFSVQYWNLSLTPQTDRPRAQLSAFVSFPLTAHATLAAQYQYADMRDIGGREQLSLALDVRLAPKLSLHVSGSRLHTQHIGSQSEAFAALSYFFGQSSTITLGYDYQSQRGGSESLIVQKPLPVGPGYGFRVQGQMGSSTRVASTVEYQNRYGFYEADYEHLSGHHATTLTAAGGVTLLGGRVFATRPIQDAYALLRTGVPNVTGSLSNQEVGQTDARGDLLVPNLLSYYGNQLDIADKDIPLEYQVDATRKVVGPPYRGGALVNFPVHRMQAFTGTLVIDADGSVLVPARGHMTVTANGKPYDSPLGRNGEFYLENVPGGRHPALVEFKQGQCTFTMEVPETKDAYVRLGTVRCVGLTTP
jgi:outer membrane usher protein